MKNAWILVAHRGGARIFEKKGAGKGMVLVEDIPHPEGKMKSRDLGTDEPGRSFDSHGSRHSLEPEVTPSAHVAGAFARRLAEILEEGRVLHRYSELILVAEARFLGLLRAALSRETAALVTGAVGKDLVHIEAREVHRYLAEVLPA